MLGSAAAALIEVRAGRDGHILVQNRADLRMLSKRLLKSIRAISSMAAADLIINDTLQLSYEQGFPKKLELNKEYSFEKDKRRLYRLPPARVFLAHNQNGRWDYQGEALITELTILPLESKTIGKFKVVKLYSEEHRKVWNENQQPAEY